MKIAILAPSPVPFVIGGAEKLWWGMLHHINQHTAHEAELIKLPSPERTLWEILDSYRRFSELDLSHFDRLISTKYPAWMCHHHDHIVYLQHHLRGLYDTYPAELPVQPVADHPQLAALQRFLADSQTRRYALPELWQRLAELRAMADLPADFSAFPGPWSRLLVHHLDRIGMQPRHIRRYFCISGTVAARRDYFPPGIRPTVLHHPSDLTGYPAPAPHAHPAIFTLSRLDPPKRLDLLIRAYCRANVALPLRIAGSGPDEARLRQIAAGHPGIQFLGRLTDTEVLQEYARALFVPFIPYQEDMGLITLEAFASGKAVLTVSDAGGPTEFVQHGSNGLIVPPDETALADALRELAADPARTRALGLQGRADAAEVNWPNTVAPLLKPYPRRRILVLNTFPATPVNSGGRARLFNLYLALSRHHPVTLLCLSHYGSPAQTLHHTPDLTEIHVPQPLAHYRKEQAMEAQLGASVGDIAAMLHPDDLTELAQTFRALSREADLVISAHCYLYPLIEAHYPQGEVWYDAYNVETALKAQILAHTPQGASCVEAVRQVEQRLCARSARILAVSASECRYFIEAHGKSPHAVHHVPNGVDIAATPYHDAAARAANRARLGLGARRIALFMGSYHGPNISAARSVVELARQMPHLDFWLLGSVCIAFAQEKLPSNLYLLGVQPEAEKQTLLGAADIALNPMHEGAGTSLKVLEFAAGGLSILSTAHGMRGLDFDCQTEYWCANMPTFHTVLAELLLTEPQQWDSKRQAARNRVLQKYNWIRVLDEIIAIM